MNAGSKTKYLKSFLKGTALYLSFVLISNGLWIAYFFGQPSTYQILYHISFGIEGLSGTDPALLHSYIIYCLVIPFLMVALGSFVKKTFFSTKLMKSFLNLSLISKFSRYPAQEFHNFPNKIFKIFLGAKEFNLLCVSGLFFLTKISFWQHLTFSKTNEDYFFVSENLREPIHKRNLILVYVESMETTFKDPDIFGRNLLSPMDKVSEKAVNFDFTPNEGSAGFTMGAIIATQCGIKLGPYPGMLRRGQKLKHPGNRIGEMVATFLPGAVCLGDVLKAAGYTNVFLEGSDLDFSGTGKFLSNHGYSKIYGKEEWIKLGKTLPDKWWGLNDDELFREAKLELERLKKSKQPFNLTLLTIDTHPPSGYINKTCKMKGAQNYNDIIECTAFLLADFVNFYYEHKFNENTDMVILGDHFFMRPDSLGIKESTKRGLLNLFFSTSSLPKNSNVIYHLDFFSTILNMLGFEFPENRLGLGVSVFGQKTAYHEKYHSGSSGYKNVDLSEKQYYRLWEQRADHFYQ